MISLLQVHALTQGAFAARVRTAAMVAAAAVPWTAADYQSAGPAEQASRRVMQGGDLTAIIARAAAKARELGVQMDGADDVAASDEDLIALVSGLLLEQEVD